MDLEFEETPHIRLAQLSRCVGHGSLGSARLVQASSCVIANVAKHHAERYLSMVVSSDSNNVITNNIS